MQPVEDQIMNHLEDADAATADQIADSIGVEADQVVATLEILQDRGKVDYYRSGYPLKWGISDSI